MKADAIAGNSRIPADMDNPDHIEDKPTYSL